MAEAKKLPVLVKSVSEDGGHWYTPAGEPAYTYINSRGEEANTTLREARKLNLYASVTTQSRMIPAPQLQDWIIEQHILAAATLPRVEGESGEQFVARVRADADAQRDAAAAFGTRAHTAIEQTLRGETVEDPVMLEIATASVAAVVKQFPEVVFAEERSFAKHFGEFAFGGRVDLYGTSQPVIIDWKGKDGDVSNQRAFQEQICQAAAYSMGIYGTLQGVTTGNLFYSRTDPGQVKLVLHTAEELQHAWRVFSLACRMFAEVKKYLPLAPTGAA